jgi:pheromone shutdown protein TraB
VGAGHVEGIVGSFGQQVDREELSRLPPPSRLAQVLKWVLPLVIVSAFAYGYFGHRGEGLMRLVQAWIVPNAAVAALFTLLAGGKPLSVLVAAVASPVTSLNPTITAGMVVGLVEARLRKPTVADCERVGREVSTLKGAWRNPVSRILLVAVASTIGSALGAYIGAAWVIWLL